MPTETERRIRVIIAVGDFAAGVTSWALRLRTVFKDNPMYRVILLNCYASGNKTGSFDMEAESRHEVRAILKSLGHAIVVPNFVWDIFPICAELVDAGCDLRCIGFCRADSEEEYYAPLAWFEPIIAHFAAVSPKCAATLAEMLPERANDITTIPTGISVSGPLDRSYQTSPIRMVYGGRIQQAQKRVMDFVPLVRVLLARNIDFTFTIIGAGRQLNELKEKMSALRHEGRVVFAPRKRPDEMPAVWRQHDVFVQTSGFEGTSNSMLESMAAGTVPVVTMTESGVEGVLTDCENGFVVPVADMEAMADAIARLSKDKALLARMGSACHETSFRYSMETNAERFESILDKVQGSPIRNWPSDRPKAPDRPFFGIHLRKGKRSDRKHGRRSARTGPRLLILSPSRGRGGAEENMLTIADAAVKRGWEVHLAMRKCDKTESLFQDLSDLGVICHRLGISDVGGDWARARTMRLLHAFRAFRMIRKTNPDAVMVNLCGAQYGFGTIMACGLARAPALVVFQLVREGISLNNRSLFLYRMARSRGQQYVAVSEHNRRLLAGMFGFPEKDILLISNGTRLDIAPEDQADKTALRKRVRKGLGTGDNCRILLTVGRLTEQKGYHFLIPCIPHVLREFPDTYFVWAGSGPWESFLRETARDYGIEDRILFLGHRTDIPDLLCAADLFVLPTLFEGQPFSLLEAMAAGVPVVTTDASGITEIVTDREHGLVCPKADIHYLRKAIVHALHDPDLMRGAAVNAKERVKEFSSEKMIDQTLGALQELKNIQAR